MKRIACSLSFVTMALTAANASANQITEDMITDAQSRWAQGIVSIGEAKLSNQDYAAYAEKMISELYDYEKYGVLFKPTKAKHFIQEQQSEASPSLAQPSQAKPCMER